jgi:hypothetical protein
VVLWGTVEGGVVKVIERELMPEETAHFEAMVAEKG